MFAANPRLSRRIRCLLSLLLLLPALAMAEMPLQQVTLMPLWSPQAQFAGYYVAREKGIYAQHGIEVDILPAGPGYSVIGTLRKGQADFAVLWLGSALRHREQGLTLVNLAQFIQQSSQLLISRADSGIRSFEDMQGRRVGLWDGDIALPARTLLNHHGVEVDEVRQSLTVNLFLRGAIDVVSAMSYNEYHSLLSAGLDPDELRVFSIAEQGFHFPEDGLYALRERIEQDPALVEAFVAASVAGWQYAFAHPDEALEITLQYMRAANLPANRAHQRWMLEKMRALMQPDQGARFGVLELSKYQAALNSLRQAGLVAEFPPYGDFVWGGE